MRHVQFGEAKKAAEAYDERLLATDSRFNNIVYLQHEDGTQQYFQRAFILSYSDSDRRKWYFVFTEHHGVHVYPEETLEDWTQMQRVPVAPFVPEEAVAPTLFSALEKR